MSVKSKKVMKFGEKFYKKATVSTVDFVSPLGDKLPPFLY
jgi:hypothetical protein